jgi:tetratricopeptide (TPR) repeat protein
VRQLLERGLERQCELVWEEPGELAGLSRRLSQRAPNDADAQAGSALLAAALASRGIGSDDLTEPRVALERATLLDRAQARPLIRFARAMLSFATARRARTADPRATALAAAEADLASIASDTPATSSLRFYAQAARFSVAAERGDAEAMRLRFSDAIQAARRASIHAAVERVFREGCLRRFGEANAYAVVLREAKFLNETSRVFLTRRGRRFNFDEELSMDFAEWRAWAFISLDRPRDALREATLPGRNTRGWREGYRAKALLLLRRSAAALASAKVYRNDMGNHASEELVGRALLQLGRYDEAAAAFRAALARGASPDPGGCPLCQASLARALIARVKPEGSPERLARVEQLVDAASAFDERMIELLPSRALLARFQGERREGNDLGSLAWTFAAGKGDSRATDRLRERARASIARERWEEAAARSTELVSRRPGSLSAIRLLAEATAPMENDPRSAYLLELLPARTQDPWVFLARGRARARAGRLEEAKADLTRAIALLALGRLEADKNERLEAHRWLASVDQALRRAARPR